MPHNCVYQKDWEKDFPWLERDSKHRARCKWCDVTFTVEYQGRSSLIQHETKDKHNRKKQDTVQKSRSDGTVLLYDIRQNIRKALSLEQKVLRSELRWAAFLVEADIAFLTSHNMSDGKFAKALFDDSEQASKFTCGPTKARYLTTHAWSPFLKRVQKQSLQDSCYSLIIDETTTTAVKKQFDVYVRYFKDSEIRCEHLQSAFVKDGTAVTLTTLLDALAENQLPLENLITLSTDGPYVMRGKNGVFYKMKRENVPTLLDIGSCSLHSMHNAVKYALDTLSIDVHQIAIDIWSFFHNSPVRREEYKAVQHILELEEHLFQIHSPIRWISLLPVVERLLEQKEGLMEYMFKHIPQRDSYSCKQETYKNIARRLKDPIIWPLLHFTAFALRKIQKFQTFFQKQEPLIPFLYEHLSDLMCNVMLSFVKSEIVREKEGKQLLEIDFENISNQVDDTSLLVGDSTTRLLKPLNEKDKKIFYHSVRIFYAKLVEKLFHYFNFKSELKYLLFLNPLSVGLTGMKTSVTHIARTLSNVISPQEIELLEEEVSEFQLETFADEIIWTEEMEECAATGTPTPVRKLGRADKFWHHVSSLTNYLTGRPKYPLLVKLAKACLTIPHGNADIERGFSKNRRIVTDMRSCLGEDTVNAIRHLSSYMESNGYHHWNIPVPPELLDLGKTAFARFNEDNKKQSEEKHKRDQQKKIEMQLQIEKTRCAADKKLMKDSEELQRKKDMLDKVKQGASDSLKKAQKLLNQSKKDEQSIRKLEEV